VQAFDRDLALSADIHCGGRITPAAPTDADPDIPARLRRATNDVSISGRRPSTKGIDPEIIQPVC